MVTYHSGQTWTLILCRFSKISAQPICLEILHTQLGKEPDLIDEK